MTPAPNPLIAVVAEALGRAVADALASRNADIDACIRALSARLDAAEQQLAARMHQLQDRTAATSAQAAADAAELAQLEAELAATEAARQRAEQHTVALVEHERTRIADIDASAKLAELSARVHTDQAALINDFIALREAEDVASDARAAFRSAATTLDGHEPTRQADDYRPVTRWYPRQHPLYGLAMAATTTHPRHPALRGVVIEKPGLTL